MKVAVEATSDKYANKYNSGSLKIGDEWIQVAKKISIDQFQRGEEYDLEIKENDKGYKTVTGVLNENSVPHSEVVNTKAPGGEVPVRPAKKATTKVDEKMTKEDWQNKDRNILKLGLLKSVLESPIVASVGMAQNEETIDSYVEQRFTNLLAIYDRTK